MSQAPRVYLFDGGGAESHALAARLAQHGLAPLAVPARDAGQIATARAGSDVAVLLLGREHSAEATPLTPVLRELVRTHVATVVCGGDPALRREGGPLIEWVAADASVDEIVGKVGTLVQYSPLVHALERELTHLQRLGEQLNRYFSEIDQEMRMAGRLQRDFMPRELPEIGPLHFEFVFQPATWVSGDLYDVFRIDEHTVGVFLADAMGHGVAAGLLTMFLRYALVTKRITGNHYVVVPPSAALDHLHRCLLRQKLPNAQFVTAVYLTIDTRTGHCRLARGGHPYPLLVDTDGAVRELRSSGSLLGIADIPVEFEETSFTLSPGQKLVLYTDGIEDCLLTPGTDGDMPRFSPYLLSWAKLPAAELVGSAREFLACREGSLHPHDDMTLLVVEMGTATPFPLTGPLPERPSV